MTTFKAWLKRNRSKYNESYLLRPSTTARDAEIYTSLEQDGTVTFWRKDSAGKPIQVWKDNND